MKLQISYYPSDDILLMQNGRHWKSGANVAEDVVAYADVERKPVAIEISGAAKLLRSALYTGWAMTAPQSCASSDGRPDEDNIDRITLPLFVTYDKETDALSLESGLPMPFGITIADGLTAFYDGEDEYGKFINAVRLENAAKLLRPYLSP